MENLKLPLCPKCGDTKNVVDDSNMKLQMDQNNYKCTVCDISWNPYRIIDNKNKVEYYIRRQNLTENV